VKSKKYRGFCKRTAFRTEKAAGYASAEEVGAVIY
jgi:hypothetical protein